jgi:hypothetical protein
MEAAPLGKSFVGSWMHGCPPMQKGWDSSADRRSKTKPGGTHTIFKTQWDQGGDMRNGNPDKGKTNSMAPWQRVEEIHATCIQIFPLQNLSDSYQTRRTTARPAKNRCFWVEHVGKMHPSRVLGVIRLVHSSGNA